MSSAVTASTKVSESRLIAWDEAMRARMPVTTMSSTWVASSVAGAVVCGAGAD